jgi:DNA-binding CsgD family transcriptional regulator
MRAVRQRSPRKQPETQEAVVGWGDVGQITHGMATFGLNPPAAALPALEDRGPLVQAAAAEPIFVPMESPPPRRARGTHSDAVIRAIEATYAPTAGLQEWVEEICSELDSLGQGSWGSLVVSGGLPLPGTCMVVPGLGLSVRVNERASRARDLLEDLHGAACIPKSRVVFTPAIWLELCRERGVSQSEVEALFGISMPGTSAMRCTSTDGKEGLILQNDNPRPIPLRIRHQLDGLAAHVEHAYRLRNAIQNRSSNEARAVLSPEGKLLHAEPDAVLEAPSLTQAVKESEKARGRLRQLAPEKAVQTWKALVKGQWSVAEQVESDGKRLLLAFENAPATPALRLSPQEQRVVSYAALGHSQKYIAYELGLSPSSVSRYLSNALQKLRLKSRQELILALGPQVRSSKKRKPGNSESDES